MTLKEIVGVSLAVGFGWLLTVLILIL